MEDIKEIETYDPTEPDDKELVYDWAIVVAWWGRILNNKPLVYDKETVLNLAFLIIREMKERSIEISPESEAGKNLVELFEKGQIIDELPGLYIVPRHADLIAEGKKLLLVKSRDYAIFDKSFVLITKRPGEDHGEALGTILLGKGEAISLEQFKELFPQHLITEQERLDWWPEHTSFHIWEISFEPFPAPRKIKWVPGTQVFLKQVQYVDQELATINPSGHQGTGERIFLKDILPVFKSFYTKIPLVYLVGGICNHPVEGTEGDIDILIDKTHCPEDDLAIEFRLYRQFPKEMWPRLHFLYDKEHRGPFTNHIPLYDCLMERTEHREVILMSTQDSLDALKSKKKKEAEASLKEDKVVPFRFFLQPKPVHGRPTGKIHSLENLEDTLLSLEPWAQAVETGIFVEVKYDGVRLQIHKVKNRILIMTEEGTEVTDNIPMIKDALLSIKEDFVCGGELELWLPEEETPHQNRAEATGALFAKESPLKDNLTLTIYDCQWFEGKDIHSLPFSERAERVDKIKSKPAVVAPASREIHAGLDEVLNTVKEASKKEGSEGAMLKIPTAPYELDGRTFMWMKFKNEFPIVAEIIAKKLVKGQDDVWVYTCGVARPDGALVYCGRTFNTSVKADIGDALEVVFVEMNCYMDPDTEREWFNWWAPRVIKKTEEKTATVRQTERLCVLSEGQLGIKKQPTIDTADEAPFLEPPPEDQEYQGIVHAHQRGRSIHLDPRYEYTPKELLMGSTLFIPKGMSRDATSLKDARELYEKEIEPITIEKLTDPGQSFQALWKKPEPWEWLDVLRSPSPSCPVLEFEGCVGHTEIPTEDFEGKAEPGQIEATKYEYGWFNIIDRFKVEYGAMKPQFIELFISGAKFFNGRNVYRLTTEEEEAAVAEEGRFMWFMNVVAPLPLVISERSVKDGWMPPLGFSALPKMIREQIPEEYKYWKATEQIWARANRDDLVLAIKEGRVELDLNFAETLAEKTKDSIDKFKLQLQTWRGPIIVRRGPSRQEYHLLLQSGEDVLDFISPTDPRKKAAATLLSGKERYGLAGGDIPPQTKFNPTKKTPSSLELLDEGKVTWLENETLVKKFHLISEEIDQLFLATRKAGSSIWTLSPVEAAP